MSTRAGWTTWYYDSSSYASNNNREAYSAGADLSYSLTPRTYVGGGYLFSAVDYENTGSNDLRNSTAHDVYLSFGHTFNPQFAFHANVGGTVRQFGDGSQDQAPSGSIGLSYNFSRDGIATIGFRYGLTTTENGPFRTEDSKTVYGDANYHFTPALSASANWTLSISTFQNPVPGAFAPGQTKPDGETALSAGSTIQYEFSKLATLGLFYQFSKVNSDSAGSSFNQSRFGVRLTLTY